MNIFAVAALTECIQKTYGPCAFVRTVRVRQVFKDRVLWEGNVGIFHVEQFGETLECYAWCKDDLIGFHTPVIMLNTLAIDSPAAAVRSYVLSLCYELAA